jgi:hypothetical protein
MLAINLFSLFSVADVVWLYTYWSYTCSDCYLLWDSNLQSCFWCYGALYPLVLHLLCHDDLSTMVLMSSVNDFVLCSCSLHLILIMIMISYTYALYNFVCLSINFQIHHETYFSTHLKSYKGIAQHILRYWNQSQAYIISEYYWLGLNKFNILHIIKLQIIFSQWVKYSPRLHENWV